MAVLIKVQGGLYGLLFGFSRWYVQNSQVQPNQSLQDTEVPSLGSTV